MAETQIIAKQLYDCFQRGNKAYVCGNGGSAAESCHLSAEFLNGYYRDGKPLPLVSLTADNATITAIANDYGFEHIFSRQLEALGQERDILITLSTSGASKNIWEAQEKARELKMEVIIFPTCSSLDTTTPKVQEIHLQMIHEISKKVQDLYLK